MAVIALGVFTQLQQRTLSPILQSSSGFVTGSDLSITWCTRVKIAVVAPIPSASVTTAVVVTPGVFRSCRNASRKSASTGASDPMVIFENCLQQYGYTVVPRKGYVIGDPDLKKSGD